MATENGTPGSAAKKVRGRSPQYPFIGLQAAIEKARILYDRDKKAAIPREVAFGHWDFSSKSSYAQQTVGALRAYGLLESVGVGGLRLTARALRILIDQEGSPERQAEIQRAALAPKVFTRLWNRYGPDLPSDANLRTVLLLEEGFQSELAAKEAISSYKETFSFARLAEAGSISVEGTEAADEEEPQEDHTMTVQTAPAPPRTSAPTPARTSAMSPPQTPSTGQPAAPGQQGYRQDNFNLPEGEAFLRWPEPLSRTSYEDFKAWLELELRKVARCVRED